MSKELNYKIETLNLLNQLSSISTGIIIKKSDDGKSIVINRKNPSESISYFFEADINDFCFEGEELSIYNYPEFYQLLSVFKNPKIVQNINKLEISNNNSKIKYVLTDSEIMSPGPKGFNMQEEPNCVFELSEDELKNFCKMIGLVSSESANLLVNNDKLVITLKNETHENTFEKNFSVIKSDGEDVDFNIPSEIFSVIPTGNYTVSIWGAGVVIFEYKSNIASLKIMTAELEDRS